MKILDTALRYAMPMLVLFTMVIGFVIFHELALMVLDPSPWSFIYNVMVGLTGTIACSLGLIMASRAYFSKRFSETVSALGLTPTQIYEEAGNGIAIDMDKEKVAIIDQGVSVSIPLSSVRQLESGWDQKSKMNRRVANNTLHIYTSSKENPLITVSYGMNSDKRNQALRQLEASKSVDQGEASRA